MNNTYKLPDNLVKKLNLTEEKKKHLESQWKKTLDRIEQEKITNPEKYNVSDEELFSRFEIINKKLDDFLNSVSYKKSVSILRDKTYYGYTNEEIDNVFQNSSKRSLPKNS